MDNVFSKELSHFGISILSEDKLLLINSNKDISVDDFCNLLKHRHEALTDVHEKIISELKEVVNSSIRDTKKFLTRSSLSAIKYFLKEASSINGYDVSFQKRLLSILNGCGFSFSIFSRKQIILYRMTLRWLNYLSKRDLYTYHLIESAIRNSRCEENHEKLARGIQGPWGNLDLPMQERVFKWDDVSEETYGRRADIQKQRRYVMGLEDLNSPNAKVGYYYRELRNEPYLFSDSAEESPYPFRSTLWES
jgi:hypothetical protein